MTPQKEKEIWQLMLNKLYLIKRSKSGLCYITMILAIEGSISYYEKDLIVSFINKNLNLDIVCKPWGWEPGLVEPRKKWLNERINNCNERIEGNDK